MVKVMWVCLGCKSTNPLNILVCPSCGETNKDLRTASSMRDIRNCREPFQSPVVQFQDIGCSLCSRTVPALPMVCGTCLAMAQPAPTEKCLSWPERQGWTCENCQCRNLFGTACKVCTLIRPS